jgi:hypothetical protein
MDSAAVLPISSVMALMRERSMLRRASSGVAVMEPRRTSLRVIS